MTYELVEQNDYLRCKISYGTFTTREEALWCKRNIEKKYGKQDNLQVVEVSDISSVYYYQVDGQGD